MHVMEMFSLEGNTAIVTGGSGHLGSAMSEALAEAGANVVIASRNEKKCSDLAQSLNENYGIKSIGLELDISSRKMIRDCFKKACEMMGSINILINNAAFVANEDSEWTKQKHWERGIEGTIGGVFVCTQEILQYFDHDRNGYSSIINIASMYGLVSPDPNIYGDSGLDNPPIYGAGKAAIIQFTRYTACHLASLGVRVNCISPGPFPNPEIQNNHMFISNLERKVPLGRIGQPHELKGAVVFLASRASSYITGHNLVVDGGWTAW